MKKLLILFVFLLGAIMLSSCNNGSDFVFRNKTKQTKAEIQEKMLFYSNHLLSTIDETLSQNMHLDNAYVEEPEEEIPYIYRDDLPPQYDYPYNPDIPDPEFIRHSAEALNLYYETLNLCDEFEEDVFGGAVPRNYFPAVEKGLIEAFEHGPLAGFPVINVKAILYDGSFHPVDSNEISFKLAAGLAFKDAVKTCQPTILEPIVKVEVTIKDQFVGDVMGDMNKRRGRVLGMNQSEGFQVVIAEVPEAEIVKYAIDLKAMTQGSGSFTREFLRYEEVPHMLIDKIVEAYKK